MKLELYSFVLPVIFFAIPSINNINPIKNVDPGDIYVDYSIEVVNRNFIDYNKVTYQFNVLEEGNKITDFSNFNFSFNPEVPGFYEIYSIDENEGKFIGCTTKTPFIQHCPVENFYNEESAFFELTINPNSIYLGNYFELSLINPPRNFDLVTNNNSIKFEKFTFSIYTTLEISRVEKPYTIFPILMSKNNMAVSNLSEDLEIEFKAIENTYNENLDNEDFLVFLNNFYTGCNGDAKSVLCNLSTFRNEVTGDYELALPDYKKSYSFIGSVKSAFGHNFNGYTGNIEINYFPSDYAIKEVDRINKDKNLEFTFQIKNILNNSNNFELEYLKITSENLDEIENLNNLECYKLDLTDPNSSYCLIYNIKKIGDEYSLILPIKYDEKYDVKLEIVKNYAFSFLFDIDASNDYLIFNVDGRIPDYSIREVKTEENNDEVVILFRKFKDDVANYENQKLLMKSVNLVDVINYNPGITCVDEGENLLCDSDSIRKIAENSNETYQIKLPKLNEEYVFTIFYPAERDKDFANNEISVLVMPREMDEKCNINEHVDNEKTRIIRKVVDNKVTATITNSSKNCDYEVKLVTYKMFNEYDGNKNGNWILNQELFDVETIHVKANSTVEITVDSPTCRSQVDLIWGDVITKFIRNGDRYNDENRLMDWWHTNLRLCVN